MGALLSRLALRAVLHVQVCPLATSAKWHVSPCGRGWHVTCTWAVAAGEGTGEGHWNVGTASFGIEGLRW